MGTGRNCPDARQFINLSQFNYVFSFSLDFNSQFFSTPTSLPHISVFDRIDAPAFINFGAMSPGRL